jgi:hypothetical protein
LLPNFTLPLLKHDPSYCAFGGETCFSKAEARQTDVPDSWTVTVPYTNPDCPDMEVFEVDMTDRGMSELWLRHLWDISEINDEALCGDSIVRVFVWREIDDDADGAGDRWEEFDQFSVQGVWQNSACETDSGGFIGPDERNTTIGFPWSWVDTTNVTKVRVAIAGGSQCQQRKLLLGTAASPN